MTPAIAELPDMSTADVVDFSMHHLVPDEMIGMATWLREYWHDRSGDQFNESQVPWVTAPEGPCDALDHPQYNELWLQWAARMFKTNLGQAMQMRRAHLSPCQMMFATSDGPLLKQVFRRFYQILDGTPVLSSQLLAEKDRNASYIKFNKCSIIGSYSGAKSGMADESIPCGHANEVDKWVYESTSTEGDPLPRFIKRGGEWPDRKFLIESTPGKRETSRIEPGRLQGTNHTFQVPCPHCGKFQEIVFGDGKEAPGIFWEKDANGKSNIAVALKTAHYVCAYCTTPIYDDYRFQMANRGVWVPEGCQVDHDKAIHARDYPQFSRDWLIGEPIRDGNVYSSQLSVFHALFHGFGEIASTFLRKREKETERRQWITEEAGETWARVTRATKWRDLYKRLNDPDCEQGVVPQWASLLTCAIDRQRGKDDSPGEFYVWAVFAWGEGGRHVCLEYGDAVELIAIRDSVLSHSYPHSDEGQPVRISMTLIDNGYRPDTDVEDFCDDCVDNRGLLVSTCEGSERPLRADCEEKENKKRQRIYFAVDTSRTQEWMEKVLHVRDRSSSGGGGIHNATPEQHQDILEQLLNEKAVTGQTPTGHDRHRWERINRDVPNDYRDIWRYAYCAMLVERRGRPIPKRGEQAPIRRAVVSMEEGRRSNW